MPQPLLSAILIVKNEDKNLPRCLASLRGVVDEIVVIDTGSTDRTIEIARESGAILGSFPWNGNEADARNASIRAATGRWLFMIDADEEVSPALATELRAVVAKLNPQSKHHSLSVAFRNHHLGGETSLTRLIRIGRNRPGYAFAGPIHATCNYQLETWPLEGVLEHYGYKWTDEQRARKAAHMIAHLAPLCAGDRPPLKPLCELMSYLLLAGDRIEFDRRWRQALLHSRAERTGGPDAPYWHDNLSNILQFFAAQDDWETGRMAAEETVAARPEHVAAGFHLLQGAVKAGDWPRVEELAARLRHIDAASLGSWNILYPEKQLVPARAWHWLAQIELGKSTSTGLPTEFQAARLVPLLLAAQVKLRRPLLSQDPVLTQILQIISSLQTDAIDPARAPSVLEKIGRSRSRQEAGSLLHLLAALASCALLQKMGRVTAMTDELGSLAPSYWPQRWFVRAAQEVAARREFSLECFGLKVAHLI